jgi:hypothetical protein
MSKHEQAAFNDFRIAFLEDLANVYTPPAHNSLYIEAHAARLSNAFEGKDDTYAGTRS